VRQRSAQAILQDRWFPALPGLTLTLAPPGRPTVISPTAARADVSIAFSFAAFEKALIAVLKSSAIATANSCSWQSRAVLRRNRKFS
jgi:hypothetical protein